MRPALAAVLGGVGRAEQMDVGRLVLDQAQLEAPGLAGDLRVVLEAERVVSGLRRAEAHGQDGARGVKLRRQAAGVGRPRGGQGGAGQRDAAGQQGGGAGPAVGGQRPQGQS